jgi:hypothetical protein
MEEIRMSSYLLDDFTFDEGDQEVGRRAPRFSGTGGEAYRLSFAWWPGMEDGEPDFTKKPIFKGAKTHYIKDVGYVFHQGPEYSRLTGKDPKTRITTVVVQWPTDKQGAIDMKRLQEGEYKVLYWSIAEDKYDTIKAQQREWPFGEFDLLVKCIATKFQKMTFSPAKKCILATLHEKKNATFTRISSEVKDLVDSIVGELGRELSISEIKERLGAAREDSRPVDSALADDDVDAMVDSFLDD